MNCIAIDDEPLALEIIQDHCSKIPFIKLKATCSSAIEAIPVIKEQNIDLIFLDIHMPNINGLDFVKSMQEKPMIIFTTAYSKYALNSYELNAIDYLLKPIAFERFTQAANKAFQLHKLKQQPQAQTDNYILLKADYKTLKVNFDDICYIKGLKDYVKVFLKNQKTIITKTSMKTLQERLPINHFFRIHKSYIIGICHIEAIVKNRVVICKEYLPVGDTYKKTFFQFIANKSL